MAPRLNAGQYVLERAVFCTSLRPASVSLPTNCIFAVVPVALAIQDLGPFLYVKGIYTQGEQSSSVYQSRK
jgi:hypothetical protein